MHLLNTIIKLENCFNTNLLIYFTKINVFKFIGWRLLELDIKQAHKICKTNENKCNHFNVELVFLYVIRNVTRSMLDIRGMEWEIGYNSIKVI